MGVLASIVSAFGLSGAAGLNAYIPLLLVGLAQRFGWLNLAQPFDVLANPWALGIIFVLGAIEFVADKVPGVDHINDVIQTVVRPAAGAVLFAANTGVVTGMDPVVSLVIGLLTAGGVHAGKAMARPVVNATTLGVGAPFVSVIEDMVSATSALLAIFLPAVLLLFLAFIGYVVFRIHRRISLRNADDSGPTIVVRS